jgi:hypothetical protein
MMKEEICNARARATAELHIVNTEEQSITNI